MSYKRSWYDIPTSARHTKNHRSSGHRTGTNWNCFITYSRDVSLPQSDLSPLASTPSMGTSPSNVKHSTPKPWRHAHLDHGGMPNMCPVAVVSAKPRHLPRCHHHLPCLSRLRLYLRGGRHLLHPRRHRCRGLRERQIDVEGHG